jgi:hypothetical protein
MVSKLLSMVHNWLVSPDVQLQVCRSVPETGDPFVTSRHWVPYKTSWPVEETVQFCEVESPEVMQLEMVTGVPFALEVAVRHLVASTAG